MQGAKETIQDFSLSKALLSELSTWNIVGLLSFPTLHISITGSAWL